jgi:hypothetical protein
MQTKLTQKNQIAIDREKIKPDGSTTLVEYLRQAPNENTHQKISATCSKIPCTFALLLLSRQFRTYIPVKTWNTKIYAL